jgi:hypothetical protein
MQGLKLFLDSVESLYMYTHLIIKVMLQVMVVFLFIHKTISFFKFISEHMTLPLNKP